MSDPDYYLPTFTGKRFHFLHPSEDEIDIEDIAHSLAGLPRYLAHTACPYSVAEHTIRLVEYARAALDCSENGARCLLLHDGAEAYIGEWPKPLKLSVIGAQLREYEDGIQKLIFRKYGCTYGKLTEMMIGQLDRAIVYVETEMTNQMKYSELPIPLAEEEIWLGEKMFHYFQTNGYSRYGWNHRLAKERFLSLAKFLKVE